MSHSNRRDFLKAAAVVAAGASVLGTPAVAAASDNALPNPFPRILGPNAGKYVQEVLASGLTEWSEMVTRFEKAFAKALGLKHCIGTPGCTPALHTLAAAFEFEPGDEIIVSPITDYGTIQGLVRENYIPVFADAAPGTVNLSAETIEPCITDRTRAILCVHKTGLTCDMDPIMELAKRRKLLVYEDVCQGPFGRYKGRLNGTLAHAAAFSFDPEKTMPSDRGGCVVTSDDRLADRIRMISIMRGVKETKPGFGRVHDIAGNAYYMTGCTAAICLAQLEIIHEHVARRDKMVRLLSKLIGEIPGVTPLPIPDFADVYSPWMFSMNLDLDQFRCTADEFSTQLAAAGISDASTARYYFPPIGSAFLERNARKKKYPYSMPPASREYHYGAESCPRAWKFLQSWIRWSSFCEKYTEKHCELAARIVRQVAAKNRK
jgi:perosamine synthetase